MTTTAAGTPRTSALVVALLHAPLVAIALLMLHFGWIVQIPAMGCDTGAMLCRDGLRDTGEALATSGPSAVLLVSVIVSIHRLRRAREAGRVPVLGLLAALLVIAAAASVVLASTVLGG